jgi:aryl-alcohol dehydrogenase-like predicted oxidoreductase
LRAAQQITPVVSVQNRYNVADRTSESMVDRCELEQIAFLPWAPIQQAGSNPAVAEAARRHGASPRQIVLAWLLARSPQILVIPGTDRPGASRPTSPPHPSAKPRGGRGNHPGRVTCGRIAAAAISTRHQLRG